MKIYDQLSSIGFLNKYSYKFLFVAFIGIHIPLIGIIIFIVTSQSDKLSPTSIILIVLALTLFATGITLYFLNLLLAPLIRSKEALESYVNQGELPSLPENYNDEAGILMQKLQFTLLRLDELVKAKDDLISLISHDVRTPLAHIINYAELAKMASQDEKVVAYSDKIVASSNHQLKTLESILVVLQQQGVHIQETDKQLVDAQKLIEQSIVNLEPQINDKKLKMDLNIQQGIHLKVEQNLFTHVLDNIINNAVKFSPNEGIIKINCSSSTNNSINISVQDQGIGFEPNNKEKIFNRFTKFGQAGTKGETSTGLGLYVSRRIIEKHGGKISAKSEGKNKGAEFLIELPQ